MPTVGPSGYNIWEAHTASALRCQEHPILPVGNFSLGSSLGRHREHTVAGALWLHRVFSVSMVFLRGGDEAEAAVVPAAAASSQPSFPLRGLLVERAPRCRGRTEQCPF